MGSDKGSQRQRQGNGAPSVKPHRKQHQNNVLKEANGQPMPRAPKPGSQRLGERMSGPVLFMLSELCSSPSPQLLAGPAAVLSEQLVSELERPKPTCTEILYQSFY